MKIEIITREDLIQWKEDILTEIKAFRRTSTKQEELDRVWLKSAEVRKLLGISTGTLQNLRVTGTLPFRKIGGTLFYHREDLDHMMNGNNNLHGSQKKH